MMNPFKNIFFCLAVGAGLCAVSCVNDMGIEEPVPVTVFDLDMEPMSDLVVTKAAFTDPNIETKVTSVTLAAYENHNLVKTVYFSSSQSTYAMPLVDGRTYNIYAVVNVGDYTSEFPSYESTNNISSIDYYISTAGSINTSGIPMSGKRLNFVAGSSSDYTIPVKRLFAKVVLNITYPDEFDIYNVKIRKSNRDLSLFADNVAGGGHSYRSTWDTVANDNYGGSSNTYSAVFYVPENLGGTISGITASTQKDPDVNSSVSSMADYLSYIEVYAMSRDDGSDSMDYSGELYYRSYLGNNATSNFDIKRNCVYIWNIDYNINNVFTDTWKIDTDYMTVYRYRYDALPSSLSIPCGGSATWNIGAYTDTFSNGSWTTGTSRSVQGTSFYTFRDINSAVATSAVTNSTTMTTVGNQTGSSTVIVTIGGETVTIPVTVYENVTYQYRLVLSPNPLEMFVGESASFTPYLHVDKYINGVLSQTDYDIETLSASSIDWTFDDTNSGYVSSTAGSLTFTGVATGSCNLKAYYNETARNIHIGSLVNPVNVLVRRNRLELSTSSVTLYQSIGDAIGYSERVYVRLYEDVYCGNELRQAGTTFTLVPTSGYASSVGSFSSYMYSYDYNGYIVIRSRNYARSGMTVTVRHKTLKDASNNYLQCNLTVNVLPYTVTGAYSITPVSSSIMLGESVTFHLYYSSNYYWGETLVYSSGASEVIPYMWISDAQSWSTYDGAQVTNEYDSVTDSERGWSSSTLGLYTPIGADTYVITARGYYNGSDYATASLEVTDNPRTYTYTISPSSVTLQTGEAYNFSVYRHSYDSGYEVGDPVLMDNGDFDWHTSNGNASVNSIGTVIAGSNDNTTSLVYADLKSTASNYALFTDRYSTHYSTVNIHNSTIEIDVDPDTATINIDGTQQYSAYLVTDGVKASSPLSSGVTWTTGDSGIASVSSGGLVTGVSGGTTTVTAMYEGRIGSASVTVNGDTYTYTNLVVSPSTASVGLGGSYTFAAKCTKKTWRSGSCIATDSNYDVTSQCTWSQTSNTGVATRDGSVKGKYNAGTSSTGTVTFTATWSGITSGSTSASGSLTVVSDVYVYKDLEVTPASASVNFGGSYTFAAKCKKLTYRGGSLYATDNNYVVTSQATWSSSDTSVASVDGSTKGKFNASSSNTGTVTVTAHWDGITDGSQDATATLTVNDPHTYGLEVLPASSTVNIGGTAALSAYLVIDGVRQSSALSSGVSWNSSDTTIATVNSSGTVTGVSMGTVTITASYLSPKGTVSGTATVSVDINLNVDPGPGNGDNENTQY